MTTSTRTAFSWNAWTCSWETTVEVAVQPQETMWAALTALIPGACQGVALTLGQDREVGCRIEVTPEAPPNAADPTFWVLTLSRALWIRRSAHGGTLVTVPLRADERVLGAFGLLFAPNDGLSGAELWAVQRLGVMWAETLLPPLEGPHQTWSSISCAAETQARAELSNLRRSARKVATLRP